MNVTVESIQGSEQVSFKVTTKQRMRVVVPDISWKWIPGCGPCNNKRTVCEAYPCPSCHKISPS